MLFLLDKTALEALRGAKNLLAFSGGTDSSALFYLLLQENIEFDLAIVDYGLRKQSVLEVEYAKNLGQKYAKLVFVQAAPKFECSFEKNARDFRYAFFETIINEYCYENLITAHQLNDRFEWFLMRLAKGSGIDELVGMKTIEERKSYKLIRPLLKTTRAQIDEFLVQGKHLFFNDASNKDKKYERNRFRLEFTEPLIAEFANGIKKSFDILETQSENHKWVDINESALFLSGADKILKMRKYLPSGENRKLLNAKKPCVIGGKWAIDYDRLGVGFLAPYINITMNKEFREECRTLDIPPKVRPYFFNAQISPKLIDELRNKLLQ